MQYLYRSFQAFTEFDSESPAAKRYAGDRSAKWENVAVGSLVLFLRGRWSRVVVVVGVVWWCCGNEVIECKLGWKIRKVEEMEKDWCGWEILSFMMIDGLKVILNCDY